MNYEHRNTVLWHWCLFTFALSLITSLLLTWVEPWGLTVPVGHIWLVPQAVPVWLAWPLVNTLFVLTYVWTKTNRLAIHGVWTKHPAGKFVRAFLQALFVACFVGFYSLPFLIVASLVLSIILAFYFAEDFYRANKKDWPDPEVLYDDYDDEASFHEEIGITKYSIRSGLFFFYTLIVVYGLYKFGPSYEILEVLATFIAVPLFYCGAAILVIVLLAVLVGTVVSLFFLLKSIGALLILLIKGLIILTIEAWGASLVTLKFFGEVFEDAFHYILLGFVFGFIFVGWTVYAVCVIIANLFRWLFPPRPTTAVVN